MKRKLLRLVGGCIAGTMILTSAVFAHNNEPHVHAGGYSSAQSLKYWMNSSVGQYGYTSATQHAGSAWNGISTKVSISNQATEGDSQIVVYAGSLSNEDFIAATDYYVKGWLWGWNPVSITDYRDRSRVRISDYNVKAYNWTATNMKKTMAHEFGHAVSLGHYDDPADTGDAIMKSGKFDYIYPTVIDKDHLKNKWGN